MNKNRASSNSLTAIAGIHATILAILIGIISAYLLHVYATVGELKIQAIREGEKVNKIEFSAIWINLPPYKEPYISNNPEDKKKLVHRLVNLINKNSSMPTEPENRANEALRIMTVLSHRYPFPEKLVVDEERNAWSTIPRKPVLFPTEDAVRRWVADFEYIFGTFLANSSFVRLGHLTEDIDRWWEKNKDRFGPSNTEILKSRPLPFETRMSAHGKLLAQEFLQNVSLAYQISISANYYLAKVFALKQGLPSKKSVLFVLSFVAIAFFSGVLLPLIKPKISKLFYLWIPIVFYAFIFVCIFFSVIKEY